MGTELEFQHQQHKARQDRIKAAAIKIVPSPRPAPKPITPPTPKKSLFTIDIVLQEVCNYYNVEERNILSNRRINNIVTPRHMVSYMLYLMTSFTTHQIAKRLDRDPTTIGYAIHKVESQLDLHQEAIEALKKAIAERLDQRKAIFSPQT